MTTQQEDETIENYSIDAVYTDRASITCSAQGDSTMARITFSEVLPNMPNEIRARCAVSMTYSNLLNLIKLINQVAKQVSDKQAAQVNNSNVVPIAPPAALLN